MGDKHLITINDDKGPKLKHQRNSHNVNENDVISAKENGLTTKEMKLFSQIYEAKGKQKCKDMLKICPGKK